MKATLLILFFSLFVFTCISQNNAMTFKQAEKNGIRISKLDSIYQSGLHSDSTKAVFWGKQDEFINAYQKTLQELGKYLKTNKFSWDKQTKCFNRIYFNKSGQIDYFLYNFGENDITLEKEKQFDALLNQFIKKYKFPMTAETGFAQCSPVKYND